MQKNQRPHKLGRHALGIARRQSRIETDDYIFFVEMRPAQRKRDEDSLLKKCSVVIYFERREMRRSLAAVAQKAPERQRGLRPPLAGTI